MRPSQLNTILDTEFISTQRQQHTAVMLWGPPGVGKSDLVHQIGERHNVQVMDIRLSQMEPSDLRGIPFKSSEHVEWAIPAMLPNAARHGESGILFLLALAQPGENTLATIFGGDATGTVMRKYLAPLTRHINTTIDTLLI